MHCEIDEFSVHPLCPQPVRPVQPVQPVQPLPMMSARDISDLP